MRRKNLLVVIPLMVLIASMTIVHTAFSIIPEITLSVEPQFVVDPTLVAGATFTVDLVVADPTDAMNLYGFDFKLGYDTSVLTATAVTFTGNIFEPGYFVWKNEIDDGLGRVWLAATQELGALYGVNGTGLLTTITFLVDGIGDSYLELYDRELRDPQATMIDHVLYDGYFRNAEFLYLADLVRRSAWSDHHHHVISKHGNINTLHARFGNKGPRPVTVYVQFTVYNATGGLLGTIDTGTYNLALGEIPGPDLTADFDITDPAWKYTSPLTKYKVKAELFYLDFDLGQWYEGSKDKWVTFAVLD